MKITRAGSQPSGKGPADWFTGTVRIDPLFAAAPPARAAGSAVTFEPGARTAWHTHPLGQTLIVVAGRGRAQRRGGPWRTSAPATSSGSSRARSTGTAPPDDCHDPYRDPGGPGRQGRRVDGTRHRRSIRRLTAKRQGQEHRPCRNASWATRASKSRRCRLAAWAMARPASFGPAGDDRAPARSCRARHRLLRHGGGLWSIDQRGDGRRGAGSPSATRS